MARAAMTSTVWRAIAVYSRAWHWSRPKQSLPNSKSSFYWPSEPGGADQPGLGQDLPVGHVAVVEGQVPGPQVAADEQVVARGGGGKPGPGVPPFAFGAAAPGADFPAPLVLPQRLDRFRAGQLRARGQGEHEI